jgi:hypothetical protein
VGFAVGLSPALVLNVAEMYGTAMAMSVVPFALVLLGTLGFLAGAGAASGIGIGQALGPGRRTLSRTLGGAVGGAIGFAAGLGPYALAAWRSPSIALPLVALAGVVLTCGIAVMPGISRSLWAKLLGGVLGGALGFGLLALRDIIPEVNLILSLLAGPIVGLAIACGIAWREASPPGSEAGGGP